MSSTIPISTRPGSRKLNQIIRRTGFMSLFSVFPIYTYRESIICTWDKFKVRCPKTSDDTCRTRGSFVPDSAGESLHHSKSSINTYFLCLFVSLSIPPIPPPSSATQLRAVVLAHHYVWPIECPFPTGLVERTPHRPFTDRKYPKDVFRLERS